jgi:hypothetical protein
VVADREPHILQPLAEGESEVAACCTVHSPVGCAVTPPRYIRRVPRSMNTGILRDASSSQSTESVLRGNPRR